MKINTNQPNVGERSGVTRKATTTISPNLKRESEMLDKDGNVIDRRTKRVIKYNQQ